MSPRFDEVADGPPATDTGSIYQHPLAYLLGLEGIALLRAFAGEYDREFTAARIREIRALLDAADELGDGVEETPMTMQEGYAQWAPCYDEPGNALLEVEEPVVREILDSLPVGVALDAACGTGRHGAYLASLGHRVIGVDASSEMLDVARAKLPSGRFYEGDLHRLHIADDAVDLVVCGIAASHVPDLGPVFAEFARVLRPGGHLVISDSRGLTGDIGLPLARIRPDGTFGLEPPRERLCRRRAPAGLRGSPLRGDPPEDSARRRPGPGSGRCGNPGARAGTTAGDLGAPPFRAGGDERGLPRPATRDRPALPALAGLGENVVRVRASRCTRRGPRSTRRGRRR